MSKEKKLKKITILDDICTGFIVACVGAVLVLFPVAMICLFFIHSYFAGIFFLLVSVIGVYSIFDYIRNSEVDE